MKGVKITYNGVSIHAVKKFAEFIGTETIKMGKLYNYGMDRAVSGITIIESESEGGKFDVTMILKREFEGAPVASTESCELFTSILTRITKLFADFVLE